MDNNWIPSLFDVDNYTSYKSPNISRNEDRDENIDKPVVIIISDIMKQKIIETTNNIEEIVKFWNIASEYDTVINENISYFESASTLEFNTDEDLLCYINNLKRSNNINRFQIAGLIKASAIIAKKYRDIHIDRHDLLVQTVMDKLLKETNAKSSTNDPVLEKYLALIRYNVIICRFDKTLYDSEYSNFWIFIVSSNMLNNYVLEPKTLKLVLRYIIEGFAYEWKLKQDAVDYKKNIPKLLYRIECLFKLLDIKNIDDVFEGDYLHPKKDMSKNIFDSLDIYDRLAVIGCTITLSFILGVYRDKKLIIHISNISTRYNNIDISNCSFSRLIDDIEYEEEQELSYISMFFGLHMCIPAGIRNFFNCWS